MLEKETKMEPVMRRRVRKRMKTEQELYRQLKALSAEWNGATEGCLAEHCGDNQEARGGRRIVRRLEM